MLTDTALAAEKYQLLTDPVLVNILPQTATGAIQARFETTILGLQARQDYRVIHLWAVATRVVYLFHSVERLCGGSANKKLDNHPVVQ